MADTQSKISTGKSVANAKDNSAVWAISKVMEADVKGFAGISDSLNLGQSTVAVARQASETVTDLLTDIKGKIVAAQEENVDREKIQTDITALRDQIGAVVGAAQFNGLNLLANTDTTAGSGSINVLASLDRSADGVTASDISVSKQDLGTGASAINYAATAVTAATDDIAVDGVATQVAHAVAGSTTSTADTTTVAFGTAAGDSVTAGSGFQVMITADGGNLDTLLDTLMVIFNMLPVTVTQWRMLHPLWPTNSILILKVRLMRGPWGGVSQLRLRAIPLPFQAQPMVPQLMFSPSTLSSLLQQVQQSAVA